MRGFEVFVGDAGFDCVTALDLAARPKKDLDRQPFAMVKTWLEVVEEKEEVVRKSWEGADIGFGCLHELDHAHCCSRREGLVVVVFVEASVNSKCYWRGKSYTTRG